MSKSKAVFPKTEILGEPLGFSKCRVLKKATRLKAV
jgi:hypothetical protein